MANHISADAQGWDEFVTRLNKHFPALFKLYVEIYGDRYDFFFHLEDLLISLACAWFVRPDDLHMLDKVREADPNWFQSNQMLGGVCYVDLFAGDLDGVKSKIPYFQEVGLTYLHLMPFFKIPAGENDGGYAVSSYREVHLPLGTIDQIASLAGELRRAGISLVLDLVFNHTSDEHTWAERAKKGDEDYREFYRIFPSRELPDAYERTLREIFPDEQPSPLALWERGEGEGGLGLDDLAIVGFDDVDLAEFMDLTTIRQNLDESGRLAAEILLSKIMEPDRSLRHINLPLTLVERLTT